MKKLLAGLAIVLTLAVGVALAANIRDLDNINLRWYDPIISWRGTLAMSGAVSGQRAIVVTASSGTTTLTAAQSGALVENTGTAATTTFSLPDATTAGLKFCFVENGDAAGELLIGTTVAAQGVVGKTHGAENGSGINSTSGIKNTAATNVKGDFVCLTSDGTRWVMTSVAGVWAAN